MQDVKNEYFIGLNAVEDNVFAVGAFADAFAFMSVK